MLELREHTLHVVLCDGTAVFDLDCGVWLEGYTCEYGTGPTHQHTIRLEVVAECQALS